MRFAGRTIREVLDLTVSEALALFAGERKITSMLGVLERTGMGYITLGQPATTISGGEAQRIKLAKELGKAGGRMGCMCWMNPPPGSVWPTQPA